MQEQLRRKNYEGQWERDVKEIALDFDRAIQALEEVEQYRTIAEVIKDFENVEKETLALALEELKKYRALGTVEELKEAREKQIAKKVITPPCNACDKELCDCECEHFAVTYRDDYRCPNCDSNRVYMQEYELRFDCCPNCGQRLDWSK